MPDERVVHIVDDDGEFRLSLEALLQQAGFATISYETAASVLERVLELTTGCMLLDVHLPGMDGLALQARLNELNVDLPVIVMTGHGDIATAVRAMKAGSVDFIAKPFDDEPLLAAIEAALERASHDHTIAEAVALVVTLSPREREVLDGVMAGRSTKVIAFDLGISPRTVEVHRARMLDRLGVRNIAGAIRLAVIAGLARADRSLK